MLDVVAAGVERYGKEIGSILELGCGDGSVSLELASVGFGVSGIDIVPIAIDWANEKSLFRDVSAEFVVGEVTDLPYLDCSFDFVLDASCSHCIIGADRSRFFSEAFRVLRSNGLFILSALCGDPSGELKEYFDSASRCLIRDSVAGRFYGTAAGILEEVETAGFRVLDWYTETSEYQDEEMVLYCVK